MLEYIQRILKGARMIDSYLLEELVTYATYGTLSATAEALNITQPSVTRGLKKLEEDLGVTLFNRTPNKMTLTKTGEFAVQEAKKLLDANQEFIAKMKQYDLSQKTIRLASVAPGPFYLMAEKLKQFSLDVSEELLDQNNVADALRQHQFELILSSKEIHTDDIDSEYIGTEFLSVNIDQLLIPDTRTQISFKELDKMTFIVFSEIGIWKSIIQKELPNAKFIYQDQQDNFLEIISNSNFPYFVTNLVKQRNQPSQFLRRTLTITDESAQLDFHLSYLKDDKKRLAPLIQSLQDTWGELEFE